MAVVAPPSRFDTLELGEQGLSLRPRLRFHLSFTRSHLSLKPFDEWQLRQSLLSFLRNSLSFSIPDTDLSIRRHKDLHKSTRREEDVVASGALYIWDLCALKGEIEQQEDLDAWIQKKEAFIVDKLCGIELNLGGVKLKCHAHTDERDDFAVLKQSWHKDGKAIHTGLPDTIIVKGIPSRWLAELRISSKASVLVTHTVFSYFGTIRHVDIQENALEPFSCNVWVQFERHSSFYSAIRAFCGRSMLKEGSSFKANYDVSWDNEEYFSERNIRKRRFEKDQAEESRRRQAAFGARQVEIASRNAELAKLEHQRSEKEQVERLREEEKARKERESALAEQEMERKLEVQWMKEEEERQQEKMQREQEEKSWTKLRKFEYELIKDDDQWNKKQREVEFQEDKKTFCRGEDEKKVMQKTHVMDRWSNEQHNSAAQRNEENRPVNSDLKQMAHDMDTWMNKHVKCEIQRSRQDRYDLKQREHERDLKIEKYQWVAHQSKESINDVRQVAHEIDTGTDRHHTWDTQKSNEKRHDVRPQRSTVGLIDEDMFSKNSLLTRRIEEHHHHHHHHRSPNKKEETHESERMQGSSEDNEFKRWELYGPSGTSEAGRSVESIGRSYDRKRIRSVIVDLRDV